MLRRLGLAAEPDDQRAFLLPAIKEALKLPGSRVLISGTADEATPALVADAGTAAQPAPAITVLDRCATPLIVNEEFGATSGIALTTAQSDILSYVPAEPFDLIVTHSFLGQFAPEHRPQLMKKWFGLLRPGGRVITVNRLRQGNETRAFSHDAAERLAAEVRNRIRPHAKEIGIEPDEVAAAALRYAQERPASFPVRSLEEIVSAMESVGFRMLHATTGETAGRVRGIEGPGLPRAGIYAEIVAERP